MKIRNLFELILSFTLIILLLEISGCTNDKPAPPDNSTTTCVTDSITYTNSIKAILDQNCVSCHCPDQTCSQNGTPMDSYQNIISNTTTKDNISCTVNHGNGCPPMPNSAPKLDDCSIRKIDAWVSNGFPE